MEQRARHTGHVFRHPAGMLVHDGLLGVVAVREDGAREGEGVNYACAHDEARCRRSIDVSAPLVVGSEAGFAML